MNENVDLKPYLKYNDSLIAALRLIVAPLNWVATYFENMSRKRTQKMCEKWLAE